MPASPSDPKAAMLRLSALALLVSSMAFAAPVPKEKGKELYFPTRVGAVWVMTVQLPRKASGETTESVTKVEEKDGVYLVTVERNAVVAAAREITYAVSDKGVFLLPSGGRKTDTRPVVKLPAKAGDTWQVESPGPRGVPIKDTYTVGKVEDVEVPAGKYKAVRVDSEIVTAVGVTKISTWFAPAVGVVKTEAEFPDGEKSSSELKSFTPGTDEPKKDK